MYCHSKTGNSGKMTQIEKLSAADRQSLDIVDSNIQQLKELFPDVFTEGKINFDRLRELLGNYVVNDEDHYNFTWHGKRAAGVVWRKRHLRVPCAPVKRKAWIGTKPRTCLSRVITLKS